VLKATDSSQTLVWDAERRPFGERTVSVEQIEVPLGFPGQYYDEESNNYYNYFRTFDPATGKYLESDPIGLKGGINTYSYVLNNPLFYVDPYGLIDMQEIINDVIDAGPIDTIQGYIDSENALGNAQASGLPGAHNGQQDAYRHCIWSCIMASNINQGDAKDIADNHETAGNNAGQPANEAAMDSYNNAVGRLCAHQAPQNDPRSCPTKCLNELLGGGLQATP
jgi:RHS repeat-associated protein